MYGGLTCYRRESVPIKALISIGTQLELKLYKLIISGPEKFINLESY